MIDVWLAELPNAGGDHDRSGSTRLGRATASALALTALGAALDVEPTLLRLAHRCRICGSSEHGVPYLAEHPEAPHVSISRTADLVGVALCEDAAVGLDLERVDGLPADAALAMLAPEEDGGSPAELAVRWVRKEAALKASGHGLAVDPRTVVVSDPRRPARVLSWPVAGPIPSLVDLGPRRVGTCHVGCVAVLQEAYSPRGVSLHRVSTAIPQLHRERSTS